MNWCKNSSVIACNQFLNTSKYLFSFFDFRSFVKQFNSVHRYSMGFRTMHFHSPILSLMCSRANDNRDKRFFSLTNGFLDFFLHLMSLSFKRRLIILAEILYPSKLNLSASCWLVGVHNLELLIIKRSLWSVVSVQNQEHDCNLHSISA